MTRLKIACDESYYTFYYEKDGAFCELGRGRTTLLATEVTYPMTFTGTFLGAFTEGGEINVKSITLNESLK
jgi:hypothetical protein